MMNEHGIANPWVATDICRSPQRAPDALRSNPRCGRPGRYHQAGLGREAHIAAHLPSLPSHATSPVRHGPFDDPNRARI